MLLLEGVEVDTGEECMLVLGGVSGLSVLSLCSLQSLEIESGGQFQVVVELKL